MRYCIEGTVKELRLCNNAEVSFTIEPSEGFFVENSRYGGKERIAAAFAEEIKGIEGDSKPLMLHASELKFQMLCRRAFEMLMQIKINRSRIRIHFENTAIPKKVSEIVIL